MASEPFLKLTTHGVYRGVAAFHVATSLDGVIWKHWSLFHMPVDQWYLFVLECWVAFGSRVVIEGSDKLAEWRSTCEVA